MGSISILFTNYSVKRKNHGRARIQTRGCWVGNLCGMQHPTLLLVNFCGLQVLESFSLYLPDLAALESHASANHPYTVADLDDATFEAVDGDYGDGVQLVRAKFRLKPNSI